MGWELELCKISENMECLHSSLHCLVYSRLCIHVCVCMCAPVLFICTSFRHSPGARLTF